MDKMKFESPDLTSGNIEKIAALESKMRKEKQLNRRMEINAELKKLKMEKQTDLFASNLSADRYDDAHEKW